MQMSSTATVSTTQAKRKRSVHVFEITTSPAFCVQLGTSICSTRNVKNTASEQEDLRKGVQKINLQPNRKTYRLTTAQCSAYINYTQKILQDNPNFSITLAYTAPIIPLHSAFQQHGNIITNDNTAIIRII